MEAWRPGWRPRSLDGVLEAWMEAQRPGWRLMRSGLRGMDRRDYIKKNLPILMDIASFRAAAKRKREKERERERKREKKRSKSKAIHIET